MGATLPSWQPKMQRQTGLTRNFAMISRDKTATSIGVGFTAGGITFVVESLLVAILPPLGGVAWWWPNTVLLLIALGVGIACGLVVHVLTRFPQRLVLVSAICSYALIEIAVAVWMAINTPGDISGLWHFMLGAITLAHVVVFSIGSAVGYIALGKHSLRSSQA